MTEYMGRNGVVDVPGTHSQEQTHLPEENETGLRIVVLTNGSPPS